MRSGASSLPAFLRFSLGALIAGGQTTVSGASRDYDVSRKFARVQRDAVVRLVEADALRRGKAPVVAVDDAFMERFVVAAAAASALNAGETLENVRHIAIDGIFQGSEPVFAGVDLPSLYVFLLSAQSDRSGASWWCALEQCREKGLAPDSAVGDGGLGLRKGMEECFPRVPCDSDVFHALKDFTLVHGYLEKKALGAMGRTEELLEGRDRLSGRRRNGFNRRIAEASRREAELVRCHAAMESIYGFLREDVLDFNETPFEDRRALFGWLMEKMAKVEGAAQKSRLCGKSRSGRGRPCWPCSPDWKRPSARWPSNMEWKSGRQG